MNSIRRLRGAFPSHTLPPLLLVILAVATARSQGTEPRFGVGVPFARFDYTVMQDDIVEPTVGYSLTYLYQPWSHLGIEAAVGLSTLAGVHIPELQAIGTTSVGETYRYPFELMLQLRPFGSRGRFQPYLGLGAAYVIHAFTPTLDVSGYLPPEFEEAVDPRLSMGNSLETIYRLGVEYREADGLAFYAAVESRQGRVDFDLEYRDSEDIRHSTTLTSRDLDGVRVLLGLRFYPGPVGGSPSPSAPESGEAVVDDVPAAEESGATSP
jgi:outer membrane protein W